MCVSGFCVLLVSFPVFVSVFSSTVTFVLVALVFLVFSRCFCGNSFFSSRSWVVFSCSTGGVVMIAISGWLAVGFSLFGSDSSSLSRICHRVVFCSRWVFLVVSDRVCWDFLVVFAH